MASGASVVVLTPNGIRVTVKVTPNTSILQVLEEACRKRGLNASEYDLKHYNRIIELANSFQFCGLPNNATLEMVQASRLRQETSINLGLQLESGKRLMHTFHPHNTLWQVIQHWEAAGETIRFSSDAAVQPVCVFMRQEIVGQAQLESRTLRSLGLTAGSACIRLLHRTVEQLGQQANISAPLIRPSTVKVDDEPLTFTISAPFKNDQNQSNQSNNSLPQHLPVSDSQKNNGVGKKRQLSLSPVPMEMEDSGPTLVVADSPTFPLDLSGNTSAPVVIYGEPPVNPTPRVSEPGALHVLGDHHALLYHADDVSQPLETTISDSFFELTRGDVESIYRSLQARRSELEDAPLSTSNLREQYRDAAILRNLDQHPKTIIRVRFRNRLVLQGIFRGVDTVAAVMNMVKTYLDNDQLEFHLFTSPPKTILDPNQRLVEAGLVGCTVTYFGSAEHSDNYLKPDVCSKLSCPDAVDTYLQNLSEERPPMDPLSMTETPNISAGRPTGNSFSAAAGSSKAVNPGNTSTRVPKWFKR